MRQVLIYFAAAGALAAAFLGGQARARKAAAAAVVAKPALPPSVWDVLDYGAVPDNSTDNTAAFTAAIGAAAAARGGVVWVPAGVYRFKGHLTVPGGVTLRGSFGVVPSHDLRGNKPVADVLCDGTILIPLEGQNDADAPPFITVLANGLLTGVVVFYETQNRDTAPVPFPWTVQLTGNNAAVTDVELLGSWNGINATLAQRHYIARVQGQPLNIGIFVDATYDIGRIEDVHFNPWFSSAQPLMKHQLTHGVAFRFGRSDWEYVFNCFAFGYAIGYHFVETSTGAMNGNFLGIGADLAVNASVLVDASQPPGILITNGEFTAFHTDQWLPGATVESTHVVVGASNEGPVKFVDSSFWGNASQVARSDGPGTLSFTSSVFCQWDGANVGHPAIHATQGKIILNGNEFKEDKYAVRLDDGVGVAVVTNNIFAGPMNITHAPDTKVAIANNV